MIKSLKLLTFVFVSFNGFTQNIKTPEYISLNEQKIYDVEIIVFAYNSALPNAKTYSNKAIFDTSLAYELNYKPEKTALMKKPEPQNPNEQYTINIGGKGTGSLALAWFEHDQTQFQLTAIWDKLQNQTNITPLIHRAWRQPATQFESPQFVKISPITPQAPVNISPDEDGTVTYPDNAVLGQVALSKGRYLHFKNQLNLFRSLYSTEEDEKLSMIFSLTERKQVKSGEFHYFDNPWFGTLVKITQYTGEQTNE